MAHHVQAPKTDPREVVRQVLAAIEDDREEVLVDDVTRRVKQGMVAQPPSYIRI